MPHHHSHFEQQARLAIESHGQPEHMLSPEALEMRRRKHTGVELSGAELPVLNNLVFEKIKSIESEVAELTRSLEQHTAANEANVKEKLHDLSKYHDMLKNNLAEKLSKEITDTESERDG